MIKAYFAIISISAYLLAGCANVTDGVSGNELENIRYLPESNMSIKIPSLSSCGNPTDTVLNLNKNEPVTIIVHGCETSKGRFRSLADVFAFHGQQAICFNYNDRDSLTTSSDELVAATEALANKLDRPKITVIGHSQGGLITRNAFIEQRNKPFRNTNVTMDIITISSPFGGIEAAEHCGSNMLAWLSLGLTKPLCQIITGSKYKEIPPNSYFINNPGTLQSSIQRHLKIITDETNSCRNYNSKGRCVEDDYVFSVEEQMQKKVDAEKRQVSLLVKAGHVEIVGDADTAPIKLIKILQQEGVMRATPVHLEQKLSRFLQNLYVSSAESVSASLE